LDLLILAFGTIHVLATSAWFGAMLYSLVVLQPRAMLYFDRPEEFENFITAVSDGARWKVLAVAGLSALSGVGIAVVTWPEENSTAWLLLGALKVALLLLALLVFSLRLMAALACTGPGDARGDSPLPGGVSPGWLGHANPNRFGGRARRGHARRVTIVAGSQGATRHRKTFA
jgi:uncharacterized membrane protein